MSHPETLVDLSELCRSHVDDPDRHRVVDEGDATPVGGPVRPVPVAFLGGQHGAGVAGRQVSDPKGVFPFRVGPKGHGRSVRRPFRVALGGVGRPREVPHRAMLSR